MALHLRHADWPPEQLNIKNVRIQGGSDCCTLNAGSALPSKKPSLANLAAADEVREDGTLAAAAIPACWAAPPALLDAPGGCALGLGSLGDWSAREAQQGQLPATAGAADAKQPQRRVAFLDCPAAAATAGGVGADGVPPREGDTIAASAIAAATEQRMGSAGTAPQPLVAQTPPRLQQPGLAELPRQQAAEQQARDPPSRIPKPPQPAAAGKRRLPSGGGGSAARPAASIELEGPTLGHAATGLLAGSLLESSRSAAQQPEARHAREEGAAVTEVAAAGGTPNPLGWEALYAAPAPPSPPRLAPVEGAEGCSRSGAVPAQLQERPQPVSAAPAYSAPPPSLPATAQQHSAQVGLAGDVCVSQSSSNSGGSSAQPSSGGRNGECEEAGNSRVPPAMMAAPVAGAAPPVRCSSSFTATVGSAAEHPGLLQPPAAAAGPLKFAAADAGAEQAQRASRGAIPAWRQESSRPSEGDDAQLASTGVSGWTGRTGVYDPISPISVFLVGILGFARTALHPATSPTPPTLTHSASPSHPPGTTSMTSASRLTAYLRKQSGRACPPLVGTSLGLFSVG